MGYQATSKALEHQQTTVSAIISKRRKLQIVVNLLRNDQPDKFSIDCALRLVGTLSHVSPASCPVSPGIGSTLPVTQSRISGTENVWLDFFCRNIPIEHAVKETGSVNKAILTIHVSVHRLSYILNSLR